MSITVLFSYARSGGTLLNRVLNNDENIVTLSEVSPINEISNRAITNPITTIAKQAEQWYGIKLKSKGFAEQIIELKMWCDINKKHLIIRDWTYIDFTPSLINNFDPPNFSTTLAALQGRVKIKTIAFIRDSIDVYLSRNVSLNEFYSAYINYVTFLMKNKIPTIKYEDFCEDYNIVLKRLYEILKLPSRTPEKIETPFGEGRITGDIKLSRGNQFSKVKKLKRKYASTLLRKKINSCKLMIKSNEILAYPTKYESLERESLFTDLFFKIKRKVKRLFTLTRIK